MGRDGGLVLVKRAGDRMCKSTTHRVGPLGKKRCRAESRDRGRRRPIARRHVPGAQHLMTLHHATLQVHVSYRHHTTMARLQSIFCVYLHGRPVIVVLSRTSCGRLLSVCAGALVPNMNRLRQTAAVYLRLPHKRTSSTKKHYDDDGDPSFSVLCVTSMLPCSTIVRFLPCCPSLAA